MAVLKPRPRKSNIGIRFRRLERAAIRRAASVRGETLSAYVRRAALEAAARDTAPVPAGQPDAA